MNDTNVLDKKQEFKSTSPRLRYIDYSLGYEFKTSIFYEFGQLKGKPAIRFYIDKQIESIRTVSKKITKRNFKMYKSGGQTLKSLRRQREKCLELIVRAYFEKLGFKVRLKPKLLNSNPDMLITKDNLTVYIELKAYHESYICGDAEISQVMKYYREIASMKQGKEDKTTTKVILITSGTVIDFQDSFLDHLNNDPRQYVESYYKQLTIPKSQVKSLDDSSRRDIYKQAARKFKKNYANGFPQMKVVFFENKYVQDFLSYLVSNKNYDVLVISSDNFYKLLRKAKLTRESHKFRLLNKKEMERLVINGKILKL